MDALVVSEQHLFVACQWSNLGKYHACQLEGAARPCLCAAALLLAKAGQATLLEALEEWCRFGLTSLRHRACPVHRLPASAVRRVPGRGSAACKWQCNDRYTESGSLCLVLVPVACPAQ